MSVTGSYGPVEHQIQGTLGLRRWSLKAARQRTAERRTPNRYEDQRDQPPDDHELPFPMAPSSKPIQHVTTPWSPPP